MTGEIPPEIGNLHNLETLFLSANSMTGSIPSSIFNASTMTDIALSDNYLSGHLPSTIGLWLPNLEQLLLAKNKLTGPIPNAISNASQLTTIELSLNSFYGFIPDELGNLRNLQRLHLARNYLRSKFSSSELSFLSSLTDCKNLRSLVLYGNPLNGTLPVSIGNLSSALQILSLYESRIKGIIPGEIGNLTNLISLNLDDNKLTGTIPKTIGRLRGLQFLSLRNSRLQGSIPFELCHLERLAFLTLTGNKLTGPLAACLGNISSLRTLSLSSNGFTSEIPSALGNLVDTLNINFSANSLNGSLPSEFGNLKVVTELDLSRNQIIGDIPITIGDLQQLKHLSLADNRLQGHIPQTFGEMVSLEFLDLSNNSLSGKVPRSMEELLYLQYLNLSFNHLEGEIPSGGPFANFSFQSFIGNQGLCGPQQMQLPPCKTSTSQRSIADVLRYVLPAIATTVIAWVFVIAYIRRRKKIENSTAQEDLRPLELEAWRRISYEELEKATNGFGGSNLIGTGSFGTVYVGNLSNGMTVAVKVFHLQVEKALRSFDTECQVLSQIRHRNLIKIMSSCSAIDFKALVLKFMPNGSLENWLYSNQYFLDLLQRLNIMIDAASALKYLHNDYTSPIIHCDLKPSNVLLDEDLAAHVSDFGIAKLLGEGDSVAQTMTLATIGYMAPGEPIASAYSS